MKIPAVLCAAAMVAACSASHPPEMPVDLILVNGVVVTQDPARPEAQAVAVRDDVIAAVGSNDEVGRLAGPATRRIDLLGAMVAAGTFREDLLYRINVIHLTVPPLRERRDDIVPLVRYFLGRFTQSNGHVVHAISEEALAVLKLR